MHRAALILALTLAPAAGAEIRSAEECAAAVAADPAVAREDAAAWTLLGGGVEATFCEAAALEALEAPAAAALKLTQVAEDRNRAIATDLRALMFGDAARLWLVAERPDLALLALDNLGLLASPSADDLRLRAQAAADLGDWPETLAALDALIAAEPGAARPHALRAAALRHSGDLDGAKIAAQAALDLAPTLPEALFEAAAAHAEAGDAQAAQALWRRLIKTNPDHSLATLARRNMVTPQ
jgi:hypothetical protein